MKELKEKLFDIKKRVTEAINALALDKKEIELDLLEEETKKSNFWDDTENAKNITKKINNIKQIIEPWRTIEKESTELMELLENTKKEDEIFQEIENKTLEIEKNLKMRETETYFSGKYDQENAILSIYSGAGGVDAQDWSEMLLSMYLKFCEKNNLMATIIHSTPGTEAGIKSATIEITGTFAYGKLKSERGVHRLVRISPFDSDKARHTSFSLIEVIPEIEKIDIIIPESDLKIDTYRASGHGGQSVNTTDSAVRITHIPTGTVVTCQNERSQIQNRAKAMKVLQSRIQILSDAEREKELKIIKGDNMANEWGSQIRSYVIHPYQMVKDHRTNTETSDTSSVLNGDLNMFIESYLKMFGVEN